MSTNNGGTKRIFISDLHIGDERSYKPGGKHYVRLFQYTDSGQKTKLKERFIDVK